MKQIATKQNSNWPIYAYNLRDILSQLGFDFEESGDGVNYVFGNIDKKTLDAYPVLLEDDGKGYCVNPKFVTQIDDVVYDNSENDSMFNIFIDKKHA